MRLALRAIASPELSRSRSRGTICARGLRAEAPSKNEGGAGRRGPDGPTGSDPSRDLSGTMLFDEAPSESQNRKSAISPASRARCLKPALYDPRWSYRFGLPCSREGCLTTAVGASTCLGGWHRRYDMPPRAPGDARLARRDRAASAVATRVCVLHPFATTAPDPHSKTPLEAPLVDRGARIIRQVLTAGINYFRGVIPAVERATLGSRKRSHTFGGGHTSLARTPAHPTTAFRALSRQTAQSLSPTALGAKALPFSSYLLPK